MILDRFNGKHEYMILIAHTNRMLAVDFFVLAMTHINRTLAVDLSRYGFCPIFINEKMSVV